MRCKCQKVAQRCDALWESFYFAEQSPHSEPSEMMGTGYPMSLKRFGKFDLW